MRVVLAYSGGLDTSFCIAYLREVHGAEVFAVTCDLGQDDDFVSLRERALKLGAAEHVLVDLKQPFFDRLLSMAIKANARYEKAYPLHSSLQGYLILEALVDEARRRDAGAVAHGNTGLGNDQFRYDIPARVLAADLEVIAPVREGNFTRPQEWDYLLQRGHPLPDRDPAQLYSVADNMWGCFRGHVGDANAPELTAPADVFKLVDRSVTAEPLFVTIGFERGVPVALDGVRYAGPDLLARLNAVLGARGYGFVDYIESSVFGTKVRQTIEGPAALALLAAHEDLERLTLSRRQLSAKSALEQRWTEHVFEGLWPDPACRDIEAFIDSSQVTVTGEVTLEVRGAGAVPVRRSSPYSLYRADLYTYDDSVLDHASGAAFGELWGRGTVVAAKMRAAAAADGHAG